MCGEGSTLQPRLKVVLVTWSRSWSGYLDANPWRESLN